MKTSWKQQFTKSYAFITNLLVWKGAARIFLIFGYHTRPDTKSTTESKNAPKLQTYFFWRNITPPRENFTKMPNISSISYQYYHHPIWILFQLVQHESKVGKSGGFLLVFLYPGRQTWERSSSPIFSQDFVISAKFQIAEVLSTNDLTLKFPPN